jgi:hypothetical protein
MRFLNACEVRRTKENNRLSAPHKTGGEGVVGSNPACPTKQFQVLSYNFVKCALERVFKVNGGAHA